MNKQEQHVNKYMFQTSVPFNNVSAITAPIFCVGAERRGAPNGAVRRCTILNLLFPSFLYNTILFSICRNCLYDIDSLHMDQNSNGTRDALRRLQGPLFQ